MGDKITDSESEEGETNPMSSPLLLPCGLLLPNRIVKLPMEECLAPFGGGSPKEAHSRLYELWARGGWGMVITGNVQIDPSFLSTPWDLIVPRSPSSLDHQAWASLVHRFKEASSSSPSPRTTPFIVQISHPGRPFPGFKGGSWGYVSNGDDARGEWLEDELEGLCFTKQRSQGRLAFYYLRWDSLEAHSNYARTALMALRSTILPLSLGMEPAPGTEDWRSIGIKRYLFEGSFITHIGTNGHLIY